MSSGCRPRPARALDDHHAVRALQVVAQRAGPGERALLVGAGEQLVDQVAAQPQLALGQAAHPGQLHRQHRGAVLERHQLLVAGAARRGRPARSRRACRPAGGRSRAAGRRRGSAAPPLGPARAAARGAPAVSFGYGIGRSAGPAQACRLPCRSSIATCRPVSSCTARAMPSRPSPETATAVSRAWISMLRCSAPTVPRSRSLSVDELGRGGVLLGVQAPVGQRAADLLGERPQQELLLAGRLAPRPPRPGARACPEVLLSGNAQAQGRTGKLIGPAGDARPRASCAARRDGVGGRADQLDAHDLARGQRRARRWWRAGGSAARRRSRS